MPYLLLAFSLCFSTLIHAAIFTVTHTGDSGPGSLRQAITDANSAAGADQIHFSIPSSDPFYNSSNGTWNIFPATELPMLSGGGTTIDGSTQALNQGNSNPDGPEIVLNGAGLLAYGFRVVAPNCAIKSIVIGAFQYGIQFYTAMTTNSVVQDNYIGVDPTGTNSFPNETGVVCAGSSTGVTITGNLISGNTLYGIVCSDANGITIKGNYIGTNPTGTIALPNEFGIILDNAANNTIGGSNPGDRNLISGNTESGINIYQTASVNNHVYGNYIGCDLLGNNALPNGNGITIINAGNNVIGAAQLEKRNLISGNTAAGIVINGSGAEENTIQNNYIGINHDGSIPLSNHYGIIIKSAANKNLVGGVLANEGNVVSANLEIGIYVEASDSNVVEGNLIGPTPDGLSTYASGDTLIQANGVEINTVGKYNTIGGDIPEARNIISGNRVYGAIYYGQASNNAIKGNYIGTDISGMNPLPNATGICVDAASNHNTIDNNLLSGNISYGIFIVTTGSNYNLFRGNYVGTNAIGSDTIPNDVGVLLAGGSKFNQIGGLNSGEGNLISGNRYGGVELADNETNYNEILGNMIGSDYSGTLALPNLFGIGIGNLVAGTRIESNLISGNKSFGLALSEQCNSTTVIKNKIGTTSNGQDDLGNGSCGIFINQGAHSNVIGGIDEGNTIAYNDSSAILIMGSSTTSNQITQNSFFQNTFLSIDIFPWGPTQNDSGDGDSGPNELMNFPLIVSSGYDPVSGNTFITGTIDTQFPSSTKIELYKAEQGVLFQYGEGKVYLTTVIADPGGNWIASTNGLVPGDKITATATDPAGNTSEFCFNHTTVTGLTELTSSSIQVYPNPCTTVFNVKITESTTNVDEFLLLDLHGRLLKRIDANKVTGEATQISVQDLSSGIYQLLCVDEQGRQMRTSIQIATK